MNRKILQKIIDALTVGTPDKISYATGILDTLMESLPEDKIVLPNAIVPGMIRNIDTSKQNEQEILDGMAEANQAIDDQNRIDDKSK